MPDSQQIREIIMTALLIIVAAALAITLLVFIHNDTAKQHDELAGAWALGFVCALLYSRLRR